MMNRLWKRYSLLGLLMSVAVCVFFLSTLPHEPDDHVYQNIRKNMQDYADYMAFFDHQTLHEIEIQMTQSEFNTMVYEMIQYDLKYPITWWDAATAGYEIYNYKVNKYYKAQMVYKGVLGDRVINDVGFRTKGHYWSRNLPYNPATGNYQKTHFKIKFDSTFELDADSTAYKDRAERLFAGINELNLRYTHDYTQIKELYLHDLFRRAGIILAKTAKVKLYLTIGGVKHDFGLFTALEQIDKTFLTNHFGRYGNDGNLYKCTDAIIPATLTLDSIAYPNAIGLKDWRKNYIPTYDLKTNTSTRDYSDINNFVTHLNQKTGRDFVHYMDTHVNMEQMLRAFAMNFLIGNVDDYWGNGHNYYLYFHNDGLLYYIPSDLDTSLAGNSWDGGNGWIGPGSIAQADIFEGFLVTERPLNTSRPMVRKVLAVEKYRKQYTNYLREFIDPANDLFEYDEFHNWYQHYYKIYSDHVDNDIYPGETMMLEDSNPATVETRVYYEEKIQSVRKQLEGLP